MHPQLGGGWDASATQLKGSFSVYSFQTVKFLLLIIGRANSQRNSKTKQM